MTDISCNGSFSYEITNEDCLALLKRLPDNSIDLVLCDPPYGHTNAKWDNGLDWAAIWAELRRIVKPNGAKLFFTSSFFHYHLVQSNFKEFKYRYIWAKPNYTNFLNSSKMPLRQTEEICVFYSKQPHYEARTSGETFVTDKTPNYKRCNTDLLKFDSGANGYRLHVTQKPVALLEHLIKTYSKEGDTVLDFAMGSGSTGEACYTTNRRFVGCELDMDFFQIAKKRLELLPQPDLLEAFIRTKPLKALKERAAFALENAPDGESRITNDIKLYSYGSTWAEHAVVMQSKAEKEDRGGGKVHANPLKIYGYGADWSEKRTNKNASRLEPSLKTLERARN